MLLNMSHYICDTCATQHYLFGSTDAFYTAAKELELRVLGELPLVPRISEASDRGAPFMLTGLNPAEPNAKEVQKTMREAADAVLSALVLDLPEVRHGISES
jgi:ATP-binding protein involved in chromosome partitioning